ncbi:putative quinol monooxygenase [Clostridium fungisolvens]|uniref:(4S)-4-hydroxy-5-phosphonooxypentane-2,3-dione isomerase n=1 Tax=Clostridium fungisolvens TaxID=1604897 RepID=A0A6V8SI07_9CLOT|nr:putative quinol monooxygenase [Clostridium fungisolvens]GFP74513.1 (4S)-4-hydroxy-5-phosphonooxypentane-2,3-dione isomerase [Clostridium fungisolvens]
MIVKSVTFYIKPEYIEEFIEATLENQRYSLKEEGIKAFDFLRDSDDASKFLLYEVYESEKAMEEHLKTEHFNKWINNVEGYFLSPRERSVYKPVSK